MTDTIAKVHARRVWDSRGLPTVEVEVTTTGGATARGIAPAGASTGRREAIELRDGGTALGGKDVTQAVAKVNTVIAPALIGQDVADQAGIDAILDGLDADPQRGSIGGNSTTATSLAVLHTAAASAGVPTWALLNPSPTFIPRPQIQIIGGGAHAGHRTAVQDFMVTPLSATSIADGLVHVAEAYRGVGMVFAERGPKLGVADEGGFWPEVRNTEDALEVLVAGIERVGLRPGVDLGICLDIAASQFSVDGGYQVGDRLYTTDEWIDYLLGLCRQFPVVTMEDPADEDDPRGMQLAVAGAVTPIVGDDYLVTNAARVNAAAAAREVDSVLIKVNQAGTVSASAAAVAAARANGLSYIVSARSGETEDVSVAHLSVGWNADIVKVGSITRSERTAKWNELVRIDEALGGLPLAPVVQRRG
ncbi:MAG TPA: phosphopyruvate hydratase [Candidatus Lumbricidophila sp.]|nr:phosphopyruvate hydratase [Candidatus Lumbricidophila sp.]